MQPRPQAPACGPTRRWQRWRLYLMEPCSSSDADACLVEGGLLSATDYDERRPGFPCLPVRQPRGRGSIDVAYKSLLHTRRYARSTVRCGARWPVRRQGSRRRRKSGSPRRASRRPPARGAGWPGGRSSTRRPASPRSRRGSQAVCRGTAGQSRLVRSRDGRARPVQRRRSPAGAARSTHETPATPAFDSDVDIAATSLRRFTKSIDRSIL